MRVLSLITVAVSAAFMCAVSAHAEISDQQSKLPTASSTSKSVEDKSKNKTSKVTSTAPSAVEPSAVKKENQGAVGQAKTKKSKPVPAAPRLLANINLSNQTLTVSYGGKIQHVMKISSGRRGYRTPTGTYRPQWMTKMHYSKKYDNAPMPHSVFYHGGYAIHATYATGRLGAPASHGCIRLSPANAKKFYRLVQKYGKANTRISIHGVAVDRRVYAKRKKKTRVKYATSYTWSGWGAPAVQKKPKRRQRARKRKYVKPYKKTYSVSYNKVAYTWPGD